MRTDQKIIAILLLTTIVQGCKKDNSSSNITTNINTNITGGVGTTTSQNNPVAVNTQGFFLDSWMPKTFTSPTTTTSADKPSGTTVTVNVDMNNVITKVSPNVFGNNTNPYMGQFVNEPILLNYITNLQPNLLRFPGGGLSDLYFWNAAPNQTPADVPSQLLDNNGNASPAGYWYGNNTASFTLTLDNYYKVLQQTNSAGIITVNYAYARYGTSPHPDQVAAHLAANWVRYDKGRTRYWEIGNENYGTFETGYRIDLTKNQDGQPQTLTGALYGQHFKVFADSMRKAAADVGATIKIGAVLVELASTASNAIPNWDGGVLSQAGTTADFYIVHNYYTPYNTNSKAQDILATPQTVTPSIMSYVQGQVQSAGAVQVPVALTEWNIEATGGMQNVSNIAGLHAVMTLGEIIKNQFGEASRWDLANGWANGDDQGMFSNAYNSDIEPNATRWNPRPAFFYMYFFQKYFGDKMVSSSVTGSSGIVSYASSFTSGESGIILVNKSTTEQTVKVEINNFNAGDTYYTYTLNGGTDNGDFSRQLFINGTGPSGISGGPSNYNSIPPYSIPTQGGINVPVPAYGAVFIVVTKKS